MPYYCAICDNLNIDEVRDGIDIGVGFNPTEIEYKCPIHGVVAYWAYGLFDPYFDNSGNIVWRPIEDG